MQGFVEHLPALNEARMLHGCGSYNIIYIQHLFNIYTTLWTQWYFSDEINFSFIVKKQVLIITGGFVTQTSSDTASTEKLNIGETAWTFTTPLPRPLYGPRVVTIDNKIFLTGTDGLVLVKL